MENLTLLYFMDPLCGWCYGFSGVLDEFKNKHPELTYEIITGGMVVGEREGIIAPQLADYILDALPRLEEYTGAEIGEAFKSGLRNRTLHMSSIKPSLAIHAAKKLLPGHEIDFASKLQKRQYILGEDLQHNETYSQLCTEFGIDPAEFLKLMESEENQYSMQQDFAFTTNCKIQGFPAVVVSNGKYFYQAARGYAPLHQLESTFQAIAEEMKQLASKA